MGTDRLSSWRLAMPLHRYLSLGWEMSEVFKWGLAFLPLGRAFGNGALGTATPYA